MCIFLTLSVYFLGFSLFFSNTVSSSLCLPSLLDFYTAYSISLLAPSHSIFLTFSLIYIYIFVLFWLSFIFPSFSPFIQNIECVKTRNILANINISVSVINIIKLSWLKIIHLTDRFHSILHKKKKYTKDLYQQHCMPL